MLVLTTTRQTRIIPRVSGLPKASARDSAQSETMPPSSSGLGYLVLSQRTGVRLPLGVFKERRENPRFSRVFSCSDDPRSRDDPQPTPFFSISQPSFTVQSRGDREMNENNPSRRPPIGPHPRTAGPK